MIKVAIIIFFFQLSYFSVMSQNLNMVLEWGEKYSTNIKQIETDAYGNLYLAGHFHDTLDLNPGIGIDIHVASTNNPNLLIIKLDSDGNYLWGKSIGDSGYATLISFHIDDFGNLLLTGKYKNTTDFDPEVGVFNLSSTNGSLDIYYLKLDSNGEFIWVKGIGGNLNSEVCNSLFSDSNGKIYAIGSFSGTIDFDPDIGITSIVAANTDGFLLTLNSGGDFVSVNKFGGTGSYDGGKCIAVANDNSVYYGGYIGGNTDLDLGTNQFFINGTSDVFIAKMDSLGNFLWAKSFSGVEQDELHSLKLDIQGNVYLTGIYQGTVDFDPGLGNLDLTSTGFEDIFIAKLNSLGDLVWAKSVGGTDSDIGLSIAIDDFENIYTTGVFRAINTDFDPGIGVYNVSSSGVADNFILKLDALGDFSWVKSYGNSSHDAGWDIEIWNDNLYCVAEFADTLVLNTSFGDDTLTGPLSGFANSYLMKFNSMYISGMIYNDLNSNCNHESNELGLNLRHAIINPGNIIVETDQSGRWYLDSLPIGSYTITLDTTGPWLSTCPTTQNFTITNPGVLFVAPSFGLMSTQPCAIPNISILMPDMNPCLTDQEIYVNALNMATSTTTLINSFIDVELDSLIQVTGCSVPYIDLGNDIYRINSGNLNPGESFTFSFDATVSCSTIVGQTLCMQANIFPADICIFDAIPTPNGGGVLPCVLPYDNSSIEVESWCDNDSIYFIIENIGTGNMQCYSPSRIYLDGQLIIQDSFLLNANEIDTMIFSGDGKTWRLEADQHPLHPGNSHPNTTIELCGNQSNWTSGLVNIFPMNDADPNVDIYCGVVSASFDPNDKTGYPLGITDTHFVSPNQHMEYVIRFQNTGTDTAFTVIVRDTLELDFDIFSVVSGVASHNYSFTMHGPRVLKWTFNDIMLPDSTTNEEGSHGFVTFSVEQNPNLPPGTELNNEVGIYFDYNDPVITNTTSHVIRFPDSILNYSGIVNYSETGCNSILYNEMNYDLSGTYYQIHNDSLFYLDLTIVDADSSVTQNNLTLTATTSGANYQWLDCNNGFSTIVSAINQSFTPAVNGSYAVSVTENGCTDTSACYTISTIGISENSFGENIKIYPNPSNGKLFIDLGMNKGKVNVSVKNAIGQIVYSESYQNKNILELNLNVERGIYFVELMSEEGSKKIFKIIVQ